MIARLLWFQQKWFENSRIVVKVSCGIVVSLVTVHVPFKYKIVAHASLVAFVV
jgi:hypothetical protein